MKITVEIAGQSYQANLSSPASIAITLLPDGQQPSHFGAPACTSQTLAEEGFIGDTKQGGSCNVNRLTIIPHCNGTHTESIAHITDQPFPVHQALKHSHFPCVVITIEPVPASETEDSYLPHFDPTHAVITYQQIHNCLASFSDEQLRGVVIRTLPNAVDKQFQCYNTDNYPVYLSNDAMTYLQQRNVNHLLVDFPSVDKMYDEGYLSNHHIFWQIAQQTHQLTASADKYKTITEMVFISNDINDGFYLCNLQIPEIDTDAVPSRPVLYALTPQ
ncbi:cyclase family protein [Aliikangiella maris]|uniref:Cyclase family protein n=2 Tax=Aliikangiella maris TaxID=3162458 RepID=A0ABV3MS13_9GAMM